jgi:hypothetical protein
LAYILHHLPRILVKHRIVLHDQQAVVVLLQDGHELEGCEGSAHIQVSEIAIQPTQYAGVVAADIQDLVALQVKMGVQGFDQHIRWSDEDIECLFEQGYCWMQEITAAALIPLLAGFSTIYPN